MQTNLSRKAHGADFTLDWLPPPPNTKRGYHPTRHTQLVTVAAGYLLSVIGKPSATEQCRVRVTIQMYRYNLMDFDNAWGACKPIFDAIVRLGWARDDNHRWMEQRVLPVKIDRKRQRTDISIVTVEPL